MSEKETLEATVRRRKGINSVWIIPLIALVLAGWLVWKNYASKGPLVYVSFLTAESLSPGKTEVRCRSVKVGHVEQIVLGDNLENVNVSIRIDPASKYLLHKNSRFWVVRPRISAQSVSGVDTLLSGAYIELDPGKGKPKIKGTFKGLEEPPVTPSNVPGLRLHLYAEEAGSLSEGAPIYYKEYEVGKIERRAFDVENERIHFQIFIKKEYARFVKKNTRFWNASGIQLNAGANGFSITSPSLRALLAGGVSFSVPEGHAKGDSVNTGDSFALYKNEDEAKSTTFDPDYKLLLFFEQSVRGLKVGAPVEFKGLPLGRVSEISYKYSEGDDLRVPVLVEVDSRSMRKSVASNKEVVSFFTDAVDHGLRAKLSTASMLTGALYVEFEYVPKEIVALSTKKVAGYTVIPTVKSGLDLLEDKLNRILSNIEALPMDETLTKFGKTADEASLTLASSRETMLAVNKALEDIHKMLDNKDSQNLTKELNQTMKSLRKTLDSFGPNGAVQGDLRRSLDELRAAMRSIDQMSKTINEQPNSLLFGRESSKKAKPRARR